ncbi:RloB family protein [Streptomyces sp. NPDC060030]|uniref:RloB family protein n=1 Tax=Streptomyces sp. NPDC060030 TaxID=3347042 RepID=UPI003688AD55
MKRGRPLKRTKGVRQEQRRYLIYCEGECTEVQYFQGLKNELRALPVSIRMGGEHGEPTSLVRAAIAHKKRAPRSPEDRRTEYDEVWCVIDVEAPRPHAGLEEALALARREGIEVVLTNPCFELWILLHFRDVSGPHTSEAAQKALEKLGIGGYTTSRKHFGFEHVRERFPDAADRAHHLRRRSAVPGHANNPWTDVDRLVRRLKAARQKPGGHPGARLGTPPAPSAEP